MRDVPVASRGDSGSVAEYSSVVRRPLVENAGGLVVLAPSPPITASTTSTRGDHAFDESLLGEAPTADLPRWKSNTDSVVEAVTSSLDYPPDQLGRVPDNAPRSPTSPSLPVHVQPTASMSGREEAAAINITPALAVRRNLGARLIQGVNNLGGNSRLNFLLKTFLTFGTVVSFVVILAVTATDACDKPLRLLLSLQTFRVAVVYPFAFYTSVNPPAQSNDSNSTETEAQREARRVFGSRKWDNRVRFILDIFSVFAIVLFCLGNVWFWESRTCRRTAAPLYWGALVSLLPGFVYGAEILLIALAVALFLPTLLILMGMFGIGVKKHDIGPLTKEDISTIPLVVFIPQEEDSAPPASQPPPTSPVEDEVIAPVEAEADSIQPTTSQADKTSARRRRNPRWTRLFWSSKSKRKANYKSKDRSQSDLEGSGGYVTTPYPLHPLPSNLSTCPICLCDFEPPPRTTDTEAQGWNEGDCEALRLLPCGHCLHKDCLDPWLQTSGRCPVCQAPVKPEKTSRRARANVLRPNANSGTSNIEEGAAIRNV